MMLARALLISSCPIAGNPSRYAMPSRGWPGMLPKRWELPRTPISAKPRSSSQELRSAMKCRDFSAVLTAFADLLDIAGAPVARDHIILFAAAFDAHATATVSDLVKILATPPRTASSGNPRLGEVARLLVALKGVLN